MRVGLSLAAVGLLVFAGCARLTAAAGVAPPSSEPADPAIGTSPSALPTPSYSPGPESISGRVVRRTTIGVVLESVGTGAEVDLGSVVNVWRETSVPVSAIEIGDDLMVNGTRGPSAFVARYVWANIGRLDGVIRAFDGREILLAIQRTGVPPGGETRVELSRFVEIVELGPGGEHPADRAGLTLGRSVGMVIYRPPADAVARATRIWLSPPPIPGASGSRDRFLSRPKLGIGQGQSPILVTAVPAAGTFSILASGTWRYDARVRAVYYLDQDPAPTEHLNPRGQTIAVERLRSTPGGYVIASELAIREQGVERVLYRAPGDGFYWSGWSPDGRYLALWEIDSYSGSVDLDGRPLVVIDARTGDRVDLGRTLLNGTTAWTAPHTLAYVAGNSRMVWDTKTLRLWSPEDGIHDVTAPKVAAFAPAWSADGRSLFFAAGPAGQWDPVAAVAGRGVGDRRIDIYDRTSGLIRSLAHEPGHEEEGVRPSRDGTRLLLLRRATASGADLSSIPKVDLEVWLTDANGGHGTVLVRFAGAGLNAYGYPTGPSEWDWSE